MSSFPDHLIPRFGSRSTPVIVHPRLSTADKKGYSISRNPKNSFDKAIDEELPRQMQDPTFDSASRLLSMREEQRQLQEAQTSFRAICRAQQRNLSQRRQLFAAGALEKQVEFKSPLSKETKDERKNHDTMSKRKYLEYGIRPRKLAEFKPILGEPLTWLDDHRYSLHAQCLPLRKIGLDSRVTISDF